MKIFVPGFEFPTQSSRNTILGPAQLLLTRTTGDSRHGGLGPISESCFSGFQVHEKHPGALINGTFCLIW